MQNEKFNPIKLWGDVGKGFLLMSQKAMDLAKTSDLQSPEYRLILRKLLKTYEMSDIEIWHDQLLEFARNLEQPIDEPWRTIGLREWYEKLDILERGAIALRCVRTRPRRGSGAGAELAIYLHQWKEDTRRFHPMALPAPH